MNNSRYVQCSKIGDVFLGERPDSGKLTEVPSRYGRIKTFLESRIFYGDWFNRTVVKDRTSSPAVFMRRNFGKANMKVSAAVNNMCRCWWWYKPKYRGMSLTASVEQPKLVNKKGVPYQKFYFFIDPEAPQRRRRM